MLQTRPVPVLPAYGGACLSSLVPALLSPVPEAGEWMPLAVREAAQVVLLVLDGLGWEQLQERSELAPVLGSMDGGPITSVAPTTTATALTSISTGLPPARHGVVGYRVRVGARDVLNVLRWNTAAGDARPTVPPEAFQTSPAFGGTAPPVVTRAEFATTGFTAAHLAGTRLHGWRLPSAVPVEVGRLLRAGEPFVYAYYDGVDKVAHDRGFGSYYDAELVATDRLVGDLLDVLPPEAALVVTSDHGQVQVEGAGIELAPEVMADVDLLSGEGRFRWLHARPGTAGRLAATARRLYDEVAWVRTFDEVVEEGWLGGRPSPEVARRLGDVALVPFEPVAFLDPADTGESRLVCRHGSLTPAEALVPLLVKRGSGGQG
ncbi:MAG TPA: alkaline phosphatase family protein [Acidimicrobiales bacterium]|nr:alkaline phosphatase family protein [Acidimicrobiales bacterium]